MWDDVVIGSGKRGTSAIDIHKYKGLSQNSVSYWGSDIYLGLGLTIYKDTPEGIALSSALDDGASPEAVRAFLIDCIIKHIHPRELVDAVDAAIESSFQAGRRAKAEEFRRVLEG